MSATHDSLGRKTSDTGSGYATSYGYDAAGQLTREARTGTSAYSISYSYDNAGNRASKVLGGTTESYSYDDANKLTSAGGKSYSYDDAGNTTGVSWSGGSISLSWDAESRLKGETTGGTTVDYAFNGLGQRVGKSNGVSASYILADDSIDSEVLNDGAASYAHGASGLISENRGGTSKFYHADALGSVRALTNTSGTVTDARSTDAFGLVVTSSGSTPTPFGFAGNHGYQQDSETGLMRLGHRMYDASTGRFISRDPIQDGYNWYIYAGNDPVNGVDPKGLEQGSVFNGSNELIWVVGTPKDSGDIKPWEPGMPKFPGIKNPDVGINVGGNIIPGYEVPGGHGGYYLMPVKPGQTLKDPDLDIDAIWLPDKPGDWASPAPGHKPGTWISFGDGEAAVYGPWPAPFQPLPGFPTLNGPPKFVIGRGDIPLPSLHWTPAEIINDQLPGRK